MNIRRELDRQWQIEGEGMHCGRGRNEGTQARGRGGKKSRWREEEEEEVAVYVMKSFQTSLDGQTYSFTIKWHIIIS